MPRYYFDIRDAQGLHRDDVGMDFPDMDRAIAEGRRAIADMSRDALPATNGESLEILIRDHGEGPVRLSLSLTADRGDGET